MGTTSAISFNRLYRAISSFSLFIFLALSLTLKSGYRYGAILLLLVSLFSMMQWSKKFKGRKEIYWIIGTFLFMSFVGYLNAWRMGSTGSYYELPTRYLLSIPILCYLFCYPPKANWFWWGCIVGAVGAGISAIYYTYWHPELLPMGRAARYTNPIQFGNLSALLAVLCLCGMLSLQSIKQNFLLIVALLAGFLFGLVASLLSQSRGGWLALALCLVVLIFINFKYIKPIFLIGFAVVLMIITALFWAIDGEHIETRFLSAKSDIEQYTHGNDSTSIGARLSMWQFALHEGLSHPIIGANTAQMNEDKKVWVEQGNASPMILAFDHLHSDFFDTFATKGIVGLSALLLLFLLPLIILINYQPKDREAFALRAAGCSLVLMHMGFGLTQTSLHAHVNGFMLFIFPLMAILAILYQRKEHA